MSFDQDPNEQANISGADLAMMVDEMAQQRALIRQFGFALIEAWPMVHSQYAAETRQNEVRRAMFAFREWCGHHSQPDCQPSPLIGSILGRMRSSSKVSPTKVNFFAKQRTRND